MQPAVTLINASFVGNPDSRPAGGTVRVAGARLAPARAASPGDLLLDLRQDRLLPGLINAHDHLQLNTLPPVQPETPWQNAREWITQVNLRRRSDPGFESSVAIPLSERLLMGGVKNLLSGVTTVAHHDPFFPLLASERFPIAAVADYGWSHSLQVDGEQEVRDSYHRTPRSWPWMIHAAEGVDAEARGELRRLDAMGCIAANTVLIHGVGLDRADRTRLEQSGAGLVWCPCSNLRLFGTTADVRDFVRIGRVALGTDSRLSGSRDLLSELQVARETAGLGEPVLEAMVTRNAADLLKLSDRGTLRPGARADLLVLPAGMPLSRATRADIRLVIVGGRPVYADCDYAEVLGGMTRWAAVSVDGRPKMLEAGLAAALAAVTVDEPGLTIADLTWRAA